MRTAQQLFDQSVQFLRLQGTKSIVEAIDEQGNCSCRYRSPNGMKCAIGALFEDREYKPAMEGMLVSGLVSSHSLLPERQAEFDRHRYMLGNLQRIHDQIPVSDWEKQWKMLASDYNLQYIEPK